MGLKPRPRASYPAFDAIYRRAANRKGPDELEELMAKPKSARQLRTIEPDRFLSTMAKCIFSAGFVWRIVEYKWPGFEEAFGNFDAQTVARMDESDIDDLTADTRVIRNRAKLTAVRDNARFILEASSEHGSFGGYLAQWPSDDVVGLWRELSNRGSRLGGFTGPMFLRNMGVDTFMLTGDVNKALIREGIVEKAPTSKRELAATQAAFNQWATETGRPLCQLSRILACSVD